MSGVRREETKVAQKPLCPTIATNCSFGFRNDWPIGDPVLHKLGATGRFIDRREAMSSIQRVVSSSASIVTLHRSVFRTELVCLWIKSDFTVASLPILAVLFLGPAANDPNEREKADAPVSRNPDFLTRLRILITRPAKQSFSSAQAHCSEGRQDHQMAYALHATHYGRRALED